MFLVGQLSDKRMHEEIKGEFEKKGLSFASEFNPETHVFSIYVEKAEDLPLAQDTFRVKMGFQKPIEVDEEWIKIKTLPRGQFTYQIIVVCVVIYLLSFSQMGARLYDLLLMGNVESTFLAEVKRGQIWRLWTPMFLHMSIFHILFNMLWFRDLGYIIEFKFGKNDLIILMLTSGLISNLMQYFVSGPQFGGMSGVLYAMLGYIWVYKKLVDAFEFPLPKRDVTLMIGWLFLCLTGLVGPIANTAHAGGLFSGMLYALYRGNKEGISWGKVQLKYFLLAVGFLAVTLAIEGAKLSGRYYYLLWKEG